MKLKWKRRLNRTSGEARKSLRGWSVPATFVRQYVLLDGTRVSIKWKTSYLAGATHVCLSSGGEFRIDVQTAEILKRQAKDETDAEIFFSLDLSAVTHSIFAIEARLRKQVRKAARELEAIEGFDPAVFGNDKPATRSALVSLFDRDPKVVAAVLRRAKGFCEVCSTQAPFLHAKDGQPYLEVHHVQWLAKGGKDRVENACALCPNCHREAHYGNQATWSQKLPAHFRALALSTR